MGLFFVCSLIFLFPSQLSMYFLCFIQCFKYDMVQEFLFWSCFLCVSCIWIGFSSPRFGKFCPMIFMKNIFSDFLQKILLLCLEFIGSALSGNSKVLVCYFYSIRKLSLILILFQFCLYILIFLFHMLHSMDDAFHCTLFLDPLCFLISSSFSQEFFHYFYLFTNFYFFYCELTSLFHFTQLLSSLGKYWSHRVVVGFFFYYIIYTHPFEIYIWNFVHVILVKDHQYGVSNFWR